MKGLHQRCAAILLMASSFNLMADDGPVCNGPTDCLPMIVGYLESLAAVAGYSVTNPLPSAISQALIDMSVSTMPEVDLIDTQLGATTVVTVNSGSSPMLYNIVPSSMTGASTLNGALNSSFTFQPPQQTGATAPPPMNPAQNAQVDQQPFQNDPTSQTLFNMLSTPPNPDNCPKNSTSTCLPLVLDPCPTPLPAGTTCPANPLPPSVLGNAVALTSIATFYDNTQNNVFEIIPEVNQNILLAPLVINPSATPSSGNVSIQQANSFIRYVTGTMAPPVLPDMASLQSSYTGTDMTQTIALQNYILSYRTYAAQMSVALSNFYYLLSKRLPQSGTKGTSQALNEYNMATWRLTPATAGATPPWIASMNNNVSAATIQKEMAILLAEMNYQLYLNRQEQERLLSTISVLLILNTKAGQPSASALQQSLSGGSNASGGTTPS